MYIRIEGNAPEMWRAEPSFVYLRGKVAVAAEHEF